MARDLVRTAGVYARFAPLIPEFLERRMPALLRGENMAPAPRKWRLDPASLLTGAGIALGAVLLGLWIG